MNCAQVEIVTGLEKRKKKKHKHFFKGFRNLPGIWRANIAGLNDCVTQENVTVVYPDPGPDVSYGDGLSDASTVRMIYSQYQATNGKLICK